MLKMSPDAHQALHKIVGSILRTYGMESLLTAMIDEVKEIGTDDYVVDLKSNLEKTLSQYQARYQRN